LQKLQQQQAGKGRLNRAERRELRSLQRTQRRDAQQQRSAQTNPQRLQQLQQRQGRLDRAERRELRGLQRAQRQQQHQQALQPPERQRALRARQVTPQQAVQGRFASRFHRDAGERARRHGDRRSARLAARAAWRLGLLASHVPWYGPVYWPYAYNDIFNYTFWADAYEPGYWAYAYDDFFDGIFFPYGAPYVEYAYFGPYDGLNGRATTGSAVSGGTPGRMSRAAREFCEGQAKGITAWPFEQIEQAVQPTDEQKGLLEDLKAAASQAAAQFAQTCPKAVPMTPPGRLQAMTLRLQAMLDAVTTVRPALTAFYESLSDEQKARFNEIGPGLAKQRQRVAANKEQGAQADCSGAKAGLSNLAVERIEQAVQPTDAQYAALDRLDAATQKAVDTLQQACPTAIALTPVGRLEAMQKRLEAMIEAANAVRPALADFYAALGDEQKAKFNRLGREQARSGG